MTQPDLFSVPQRPAFDGSTYDAPRDSGRPYAQLHRVQQLMADGGWHSLEDLSASAGDPEASISARIRDLRKPKFGGASCRAAICQWWALGVSTIKDLVVFQG